MCNSVPGASDKGGSYWVCGGKLCIHTDPTNRKLWGFSWQITMKNKNGLCVEARRMKLQCATWRPCSISILQHGIDWKSSDVLLGHEPYQHPWHQISTAKIAGRKRNKCLLPCSIKPTLLIPCACEFNSWQSLLPIYKIQFLKLLRTEWHQLSLVVQCAHYIQYVSYSQISISLLEVHLQGFSVGFAM